VLNLSDSVVGVDAVVSEAKGVEAEVTGHNLLTLLETDVDGVAEGVDATLVLLCITRHEGISCMH